MFQATRRRLALWYTAVTAILLLLFAIGFYLYVRDTLVERIDDTLNHVVEIVQRSLVIEPADREQDPSRLTRVNLEASFRSNAEVVEDDHIDLEWFSPNGELLWSTFSTSPTIPLHPNSSGETVHLTDDQLLRQVTQPVQMGRDVLGYLRVSHPWFEVTKPTRQLIWDLGVGLFLVVGAVAAIGWLLSGLAIAPVRDSYQRLKQFTADASHELRNPIAVIQTNVQVALADPDPQLQENQLKVVERLTRRLGRLVDDLLFLARQDSSMTPLQLEAVPLDELIQDVVEEQQVIADDQQIDLNFIKPDFTKPDFTKPDFSRTHPVSEHSSAPYSSNLYPYSSNLYIVQGDRTQLIRLLTNLISNAVQYTPTHGKVTISLQRKSPHLLQLQVRDTGIGIPAEALSHIFDRFYRVDPARTNASAITSAITSATSATSMTSATTPGSGLGLAIVKVIVENHQGQIMVESTPQQGTTFTVTLPSQS